MHYHARDMAVVRAREADIPIVLASATPSVETEVNARRGRYRRLHLPERFGGQHLPAIEADRPAPRRPAARALHRAAARRSGRRSRSSAASRRCCSSTAAAMRRSRCAAPAGFASPARTATPGWSSTASAAGWSATIAASRCRRRRRARNARRRDCVRRLSAPASSGWRRRWRRCFPAARILVLSSDLVESVERLREELDDVAAGPVRHRHRHAARRQGPPFPQAQPGRRRRCRSRPRQRRSARGRAHLPAAASGGRPRRPRGGPRPGFLQTHQPEHPVMRALIAADREAFYAERDRAARADAAIRRSGGSRACSSRRPTSTTAEGFARRLAAAAPRGERRARARPGRSAARAGARPPPLPAAGEIAARLRPLGLSARLARRRAQAARASSSSRSTSIRRAFL